VRFGARHRGVAHTDHGAVAAWCRAHPGQWRRVSVHRMAGYAYVQARRIRTAEPVAYAPAGSFEAATRDDGDNTAVWTRWTGARTARSA
jgi:hypothetical protein